jgi:Amidohydrolase family
MANLHSGPLAGT